MAYLPPRIEIYQILKELGATLESPLLPFCVMGPAYRVKDTVHEFEQFATHYDGTKQTVVFSAIDSTNLLLKREGVSINLLVFAKTSGTPPVVLPDTEIIQSAWDAHLATSLLDGAINDAVTSLVYKTGTGYALYYTGTPVFYVKIDPGLPTEEIFKVTLNSAPGVAAGTLTIVRAQKGSSAFGHGNNAPMEWIGNEVYYNATTKTIGNLGTTFMATVSEGDMVYGRLPGSTTFDGEHRAYVVNVDSFNKSIGIDIDLGFVPDDVGPSSSSVVNTIALHTPGNDYSVGDLLTIVQVGAAGATAAVASISTVSKTVLKCTFPSAITFSADPGWTLTPGNTFMVSGSDANDGLKTYVSNVGAAYVVAEAIVGDGDFPIANFPGNPLQITDFTAGKHITFAVDPVMAPLETFVVTGSTSNDGIYTVVGNVLGVYEVAEAVTIEAALPGSKGNPSISHYITFTVDPHFAALRTFVVSGATTPANNSTFTVVSNAGAIYLVTEDVVTEAAPGPCKATTLTGSAVLTFGPVASVVLMSGGFGYSAVAGLSTTVPGPSVGTGCRISVTGIISYALNDYCNIFSDVVDVVGYVKALSPYDPNFVPNDAVGDYQGQITDDGVILGSDYVDRLGLPITDAVIHSTYTTYARTFNRSSRIVNVPLLITSLDDIESYLGDVRPENDLAYGTFLALASQKAGYAIAVDSNDLAGYNAALEKLKEVSVYAIAPLTYLDDVYTSLKAHTAYMSGGQLSRWRIGLICNENMPREVSISPFCVGTTVVPSGGVLNRYVFNTPISATINPGDILRLDDIDTPEINGDYIIINVDVATAVRYVDVSSTFFKIDDSYLIQSVVVGTDTVVFTTKPDTFVAGDMVYINDCVDPLNDGWHRISSSWVMPAAAPWAVTFVTGTLAGNAAIGGSGTKSQNLTGEVFYNNSSYAIAVAAKNFAKSLGDRRVTNMFPSSIVISEPDVLPGYFMAAAFSGAIGALPGPLPYTESNVPTLTKVYGSSDIMGYDHLNIVAEGGNMILYHAGVGSLPTVRDQLTTDMSNILTQNLSLVVNPDFIAYTLKAVLEPLKGKYNIDQDLLDSIKMTTVLVLNYFTKDLGGKRIISFTDPEITSSQGCVLVKSELTMATPAKVIQVILNLTV